MKGTILVVLAAFSGGLSGGIGGILLGAGWDPFVVSFHRGAIGLLVILAWLRLRPRESGLGSAKLWLWSALAGLGVAGNFSFYFISIDEGSVAVRLEELPPGLLAFDTVFSMGVLSHKRSPLDHLLELRQALRPGGELMLETLVVEGDEQTVLVP